MSNQWRFTTNEAGQVVLQVRRPETSIYKMSQNLAAWEDAKVTDLDIMGALMGRFVPPTEQAQYEPYAMLAAGPGKDWHK